MGFVDRLSHGWNAFRAKEDNADRVLDLGTSSNFRPRTSYRGVAGDRSILTAITTRMAIDVASVPIRHVRLDEKSRYKEDIRSGLNERLTIEANLDQAARHFRQDIAMHLFNYGVCALVPIETNDKDPLLSASYDILQLRVGRIIEWFPAHIRVDVVDQRDGQHKELTVPKKTTAIIENPLYDVMNEPNGTLQRLIRKLALLDSVDEQSSSGKLDMIIQLPYSIRTEQKQAQANMRRKNLEEQVRDSKLGIGYIDATEKITQLNRPVENNMLKQIEYLEALLYSQLGISAEVFKGTATADQMLNYQNRTIVPIMETIVEEMRRKFLSRTARTQGQSIEYFQDLFKLLPIDKIAEIADKFTRNEIMSSNEIRGVLGLPPVDDPKADQLQNSNLYGPGSGVTEPAAEDTAASEAEDTDFDAILDKMEKDIGASLDGVGSGGS